MDWKDRLIIRAPLVIIVILLAGGAITATLSLWWGLGLIAGAVIFLILCLRQIPATPPHVGLAMIWGERKPIIIREGWRLFAPFFPFLYDAILVNVEKKNIDFPPKNVRSRERAELEIEISVTYMPDKENGSSLIEYINVGGKEGAESILEDIVEEKCREFAATRTWEDCLRADVEIAGILIKEITGLDGDIEVMQIRRGNGIAQIPALGIVLNRLNIGTIWVKGRLGEQAEIVALEQRQRDAEKVEVRHVRARTKELQRLGLPIKDAVEVVQTERGKVRKEIKEYKGLEGLGEAIGRGLGEIFRKK